jgi:hypothetical protein
MLQDTRIGNALRQALSLDGAGQVRLGMEESIIPVAIVADVRDTVSLDPVVVHNTRSITAVAAQYSRAAFEVQANTDLKEVYLRRLIINTATTMQLWLGFSGTLVGATTDALPQRTRYSLRAAPTRGRMIGDTNAAAPAVANFSKIISCIASEPYIVDMNEHPIIMDAMVQGALYVIHSTVVNVGMQVSAEWEEVPRVG